MYVCVYVCVVCARVYVNVYCFLQCLCCVFGVSCGIMIIYWQINVMRTAQVHAPGFTRVTLANSDMGVRTASVCCLIDDELIHD